MRVQRRWGLWASRFYDLSKAAAFMGDAGWRLRGHVLVVGPFAFIVAWRERYKAKP